jgi:hypothetical protein
VSHSSPPTVSQRLMMGPRLCPQVHRQSRANKLLPAAGIPGPPKGGDMLLFWPCPSPRLSQVGRSIPQSWIQTCLNPRSHPRQPIGAWLASGPLSGKPDGATPHAQVANTFLRAGERPNKTPTFITCVSDARSFLAWLLASCPGGLTVQVKGEKLMVVPSPSDGFRAVVSALRSLDRGGCDFPQLHAPGGPLCAASGEELG